MSTGDAVIIGAVVLGVAGVGGYVYIKRQEAKRLVGVGAGYGAAEAASAVVAAAKAPSAPKTPEQRRATAGTWLSVLGGVVSGVGASLASQPAAVPT